MSCHSKILQFKHCFCWLYTKDINSSFEAFRYMIFGWGLSKTKLTDFNKFTTNVVYKQPLLPHTYENFNMWSCKSIRIPEGAKLLKLLKH